MVALSEVVIDLVAAQDEARFRALMQAHHSLGALPGIGETVRYVAHHRGQRLALVVFSAPALKCATRERWSGWSFAVQFDRLHLLTSHSRFLLLPGALRPPAAARRDVRRPAALPRHRLPRRTDALPSRVLPTHRRPPPPPGPAPCAPHRARARHRRHPVRDARRQGHQRTRRRPQPQGTRTLPRASAQRPAPSAEPLGGATPAHPRRPDPARRRPARPAPGPRLRRHRLGHRRQDAARRPIRLALDEHIAQRAPDFTDKSPKPEHDRRERRSIRASSAPDHSLDFPGVGQVFAVHRDTVDVQSGKRHRETTYGVTSLTPHDASPPTPAHPQSRALDHRGHPSHPRPLLRRGPQPQPLRPRPRRT